MVSEGRFFFAIKFMLALSCLVASWLDQNLLPALQVVAPTI